MPEPTAQERLRQTRQQLRELFVAEDVNHLSGDFPRSATMRFLLGDTGNAVAGAVASVVAMGVLPRASKILRFIPLTTITRLLFKRRNSSRSLHARER